ILRRADAVQASRRRLWFCRNGKSALCHRQVEVSSTGRTSLSKSEMTLPEHDLYLAMKLENSTGCDIVRPSVTLLRVCFLLFPRNTSRLRSFSSIVETTSITSMSAQIGIPADASTEQ